LQALEDDPKFVNELNGWIAEASSGSTTQTTTTTGDSNVTVQVAGGSGNAVQVQR
jgi:hypothetical protein